MVLSLNYRRPDFVSHKRESTAASDVNSLSDETSSLRSMPITPKGIPEALSFDRIIDGGCCPPCTKREFLNYLKYIERAPENLQFFLWFKDYQTRFFKELPESERSLAPVWTEAQAEAQRKEYRAQMKKGIPGSAETNDMFKGTDFEEKTRVVDASEADPCPFDDRSIVTPDSEKRGTIASSDGTTLRPVTGATSIYTQQAVARADTAFEEAGMNKPFTVQPYREEIARIIAVYIVPNSPRQLNLSGRERHALLKALEHTTHPSAFRDAIHTIEYTLRKQAHPNFIRWAICNGNRPRVIFARGLGVFCIAGGIIADIIILLSKAGRGFRVLPLILLVLGVATLIAAWKGMCVVLHGLHHQHVRPWELFLDVDPHAHDNAKLEDGVSSSASSEYDPKQSISIDSLTSSKANSFEDEPWVGKYKKRNVVRQVFDREIWIQEPALRQIQDTIFIQAILGALLAGAIITAIFVAVPSPRVF